MEERRKSKRVPVDAIVMYQTDSYPITENLEANKVDTPISVNISIGGLQLETNQHLKVGTFLQIVLSILDTKVPMQLTGKVIWVHDNIQKKFYKIGVEFIDFNDDAKKKIIEDYIMAS